MRATVFAVLLAFPAYAQEPPCAMRDKVLERLATAYGESRQSIGLGVNGSVVETFANTETGTWTVTATAPNGLMCMIATGHAFENLAEPSGVPS